MFLPWRVSVSQARSTLSHSLSSSFPLQQMCKLVIEKWEKEKKQKKKVEWSVFSQVSGSQVAPALTGNESLQVPVLSRCCAMRGTCPESRPECSSPGQEQRGGAGEGGENVFRPEIAFQVPVPARDPAVSAPPHQAPGSRGEAEVVCRERTVWDGEGSSLRLGRGGSCRPEG